MNDQRKFGVTAFRIFSVLLVVSLWTAAFVVRVQAEEINAKALSLVVEKYPYIRKNIEVTEGSTYGVLMEGADISGIDSTAIFSAASNVYDLSKVRIGHKIELIFGRDSGQLLTLVYQIDTEEKLYVSRDGENWSAECREIEYDVRVRTVEGHIDTSLYASALEQGIDERAIIALADTFQWTVDFAMDVRQGDFYRFIYEERYLNGKYVMPGQVFAARFENAGQFFYAFHYQDPDGNVGYYSETGESLQKMFLKAPVAFKYISSGFTTGLRYVSAFNVSTGHRAIDYAAPSGTPIRAVGDGVVSQAGWNGPYGNFVSLRHNSIYSTNYGHMSKIAVRVGQRVVQGETIGYVGSTGFSTGPHLHYEMVKNGVKINPLLEDFPGTDPVPTEEMDIFTSGIVDWRRQLDDIE
ncbi:TPA: peptidase M23 [Candidatus Uhrbacteria bacterium]|nr:peptidase M23 [Candidatus Uhrbacteria bacterium]